jgi:SAM-dependent methyltransferase
MKIDHKESYQDFGKQFLIDDKIDNYWGGLKMLKDIVSPFDLKLLKNKKIMEIGSGSGRIIKNLIKFKPKSIFSVEPSASYHILKKKFSRFKKIHLLNIKGSEIKLKNKLDYVLSLGVIHHIPEPLPVINKAYASLKKNGKFIIWVYGYENNFLYILIFNNLRRITIYLPDPLLRSFCKVLNLLCSFYIFLLRFISLPLKDYMLNVFNKCSFEKRNYIIFDQLNPSFSKYYKEKELNSLFLKSRFKNNFSIFNRRNYSYVVIAKK